MFLLRILITGITGLLGYGLTKTLVEKGVEVSGIYKENKTVADELSTLAKVYPVDITKQSEVKYVFNRVKPDVVIHAAAFASVDGCELFRSLAWEINVNGTQQVVDVAKETNAKLIYISTDYVFDGETGGYTEEDKPNPLNYYGLTKLEGEKIVANNLADYIVARVSLVYGEHPQHRGTINRIIFDLKKGKKLYLVADQFLTPTYSTDIGNMLLELINREATGIYHVAGSTCLSRYDIGKMIARVFEFDDSLISRISMPGADWTARRPRKSCLSVDKLIRFVGKAPRSLEEGLLDLKEKLRIKK